MKKVLWTILFIFGVFALRAEAQEVFLNDPFAFSEKMLLEISMGKCTLSVYKQLTDGSLQLVEIFPVATARKNILDYPFGKGRITKVDLNPTWFPTDTSVEYMNKKLEAQGKKSLFKKHEAIGPKDPRNAMGTFKMHLSHYVSGKGSIYRIHGTNSPSSIGKRASSGCIRMKNSQGYPLAENIKQRIKRNEKIEVNII